MRARCWQLAEHVHHVLVVVDNQQIRHAN